MSCSVTIDQRRFISETEVLGLVPRHYMRKYLGQSLSTMHGIEA